MSSTHIPPILPDGQKFDGTNWHSWSRWILTTAKICSVEKYLTGVIPKPTEPSPVVVAATPTTPATTIAPDAPEPTLWYSDNPLLDEWTVRDAWAIGLILYNCANPVGLGMAADGDAAKAWKSL
ncbi:hypothetical protein BDZ97DRAFT_1625464, partial [Flammula alnicola]